VVESSDLENRSAEPEVLRLFFEDLRACNGLTPSLGFYGRVLSRIEAMQRHSIWLPVIYSRFYTGLVTACLGVSLTVLAYLFGTELNTKSVLHPVSGGVSDVIFSTSTVQQQRDAVLMELVAYPKQ
jgi:hypothetical protein